MFCNNFFVSSILYTFDTDEFSSIFHLLVSKAFHLIEMFADIDQKHFICLLAV
jgi:hypothetical protein